MGIVPNTGSASLLVPFIGPGLIQASYLLRETTALCASFDFISGGTGKSFFQNFLVVVLMCDDFIF
jgi:hypothetical protein